MQTRPIRSTAGLALAPALTLVLALVLALSAMLVTTTLSAGPAEAGQAKHRFAKYAKTSRGDGVLRKGCHNYRYSYKISPPKNADSWGLETFLDDESGKGVASGAVLKGSDPKKGHAHFRFCSSTTSPGLFKLRAKFTYVDGFDTVDGWIKPTRFRLDAE